MKIASGQLTKRVLALFTSLSLWLSPGYKDLKPLLLPLMLEGLGVQRPYGYLESLNLPLQGMQEHRILTMYRDPQVPWSVLMLIHLLSRILSMLKHKSTSCCACAQLDRVRINDFTAICCLLKHDA